MAKEKTYFANWTFGFNGKTYERGDVVEITEADAKPLLGGVLSTTEPSDESPATIADELNIRVAELELKVAELEQENTALKVDKTKLEQENTALKNKSKP